MQKLDVMTKLAMWGVDVDRMREGRVSRSLDDTELSTSSSSLADRLEFVDATPQTEQVVDSAVSDTTAAVQSVSSIPTPESDDDDEDGIADVPFPVDINERMDMEPELLKNLILFPLV